MAEKTVAAPPHDGALARQQEGTREQERFVPPPVDIFESGDGLMILADLPGVNRESLNIEVKDDVLTLQARSGNGAAGTPIYREFELPGYFRQFQLSDAVDTNNIRAELRNGVLALHLPKAEEAKPKRIEVKVG